MKIGVGAFKSKFNGRRSGRLALVVFASGFFAVATLPEAKALGSKRLTPEQQANACAAAARDGFPVRRAPEWQRISRDGLQADLVLPVNFIAYNESGGFLKGTFEESEADRALRQLRYAFNGCGIAVELHELKMVSGPSFLDVLTRNAQTDQLSERERCLFTPLHVNGEINLYFVLSSGGPSHSFMPSFLVPVEPDDGRFAGASVVSDYDRSSFDVNGAAYVVPHEAGHNVMDMGHLPGGRPNLMADSRELLSYSMTSEECDRARSSRFVRRRGEVGYAFPAAGAPARSGD